MTANCKCDVDDLAWTTVDEGGLGNKSVTLLAPSAFLPSATATQSDLLLLGVDHTDSGRDLTMAV